MRAILAGGLVLGIGATLTLASWTDSEFASGAFGASTFVTQSSPNGTTFSSNVTTPGVTLAFSATGMAPGVSNFAFLDVRTSSATTVAGTITLASATAVAVPTGVGTLYSDLSYRLIRITTATTCAAAAFTATSTYIAGSAGTYIAATTVPATPVTSTLSSAGTSTIRYCFDVHINTTAPTTDQGLGATVTWRFAAVSS